MAIRKNRNVEADKNADDARDTEGNPPVEDTNTISDGDVDPGEPVVAERSTTVPDGAGVKSAGTDPNQNDSNDAEGGTAEETRQGRDSSEDPSNVGDSVTNRANDGVTYASQDGATGDNNSGEPSTKAGDAPVGVKSDRRPEDTPDAPTSLGEAQVQSLAPAATLNGPRTTKGITEEITRLLREFDGKPEETSVSATTNIFDEGLLERANVIDFAKQVNNTFGVEISVSEAQNWLLARDVVNTVLRHVAKED